MSAFLVGDYHINCLLTFAKHNDAYLYTKGVYCGKLSKAQKDELSRIGQILTNENNRSINHRYKETKQPETYQFKEILNRRFKPIEILKACQCFDYQACETDDYETTNAKDIVQRIRLCAIRCLPEYDNCDGWEFHMPEKVAK